MPTTKHQPPDATACHAHVDVIERLTSLEQIMRDAKTMLFFIVSFARAIGAFLGALLASGRL